MRSLTYAPLAIACLALFVGCSTDLDDVDAPFLGTGVNYLRVTAYDALTGEVVSGGTATIQIGPNTVTGTASENGYVFERLPQGTYPLTLQADGYITFVGFYTASSSSSPASESRNFDSRTIRVYPVGEVPSDLTVRVFDNESGDSVSDVRVVASFTASASIPGQESFPDLINPTGVTFNTVLIADTDADGVATFAADDLVLGATYSIDVFGAATTDGRFLVPSTANSVQAGFAFPELNLFLAEPASAPVALTANNSSEGSATQDTLVVTFPYAIELCSNPDDHSAFLQNVVDVDGDTNVPVIDPDEPTSFSLNGDSTQLTISYLLDTDDEGDTFEVVFSGYRVSPVGSSTCTALGSVEIRSTSEDVSTTITPRQ